MASHSHSPAGGKITSGIKPNTLVEKTISFVEEQLPKWRDDKTRPIADSEEELNGQLCKFLNDRARDRFPMAIFHHEEKQGRRRRVDLSVMPSTKAIEAAVYDSIYVPFLVIEGKRLPAPTKNREREYVTGLAETSGGIQRFRMSLHGKDHSRSLIIGYIQKKDASHWHKTIKDWISALEVSGEDTTCVWTSKDLLQDFINVGNANACHCESSHEREGFDDISLVHLWISMPPNTAKKKIKVGPS